MNQSDSEINDKNYPIEPIWALKTTLPSLILLPFFVVFFTFLFWQDFQDQSLSSDFYKGGIYLAIIILSPPIQFIINIIRRATYHYNMEDQFLNLHQGIINKQNRRIPYGVIQNVLLTRGLLDRIFGLSTLTIQNATQSTLKDLKHQAQNQAGFFGNSVQIPGLKKENAQLIKEKILKKITASPTVELGM